MPRTKLIALGAVLVLAACGNIAGPGDAAVADARGISAESSPDSAGGGGDGGGATIAGGTLGSGYDVHATSNGTLGSGY